jgi:signal transduction histidine kinase/CheY-like chemotaxis protein
MIAPSEDPRSDRLLEIVERMAGGDHALRLPISRAHDHLDAVSHAVNVLVGELSYATDHLRRARDEAEAANRAKSVFLRNVSHEIRTPLSAILGLTRVLMNPALTPDEREHLHERILSNGAMLLSLVDDLLDVSRLDADRLPLDAHPLGIAPIVHDVTADLAAEAASKGLSLAVEASDGGLSALADARRVRQILFNVIGNAIKFTARGGVRVRIGAAEQISIDVADTGIGLTVAQAASLFEPFSQADPSIGERFGGSGLGLALSKRLAQAMGGDLLLLESAPGAGATFRLLLPIASALPREALLPAPPDGREALGLDGWRVLLAEDSEDIRYAMMMLLEREGAHVVSVADGRAAVERALAGPFEVVLMDVRMPDIDGLEATRQARARGCRTPIVAITADAVPGHHQECLAAGCDAYVAKPIDVRHLIEEIRRVARSSSADSATAPAVA